MKGITKPKPKPVAAIGASPAWHIDLGADHTGPIKYVNFTHGQGVLCMYGLASFRPEWVETGEDGSLKMGKQAPPIRIYAEFFKKKGFTVKEITEEAGMKLLQDLAANPQKFEIKEPEEEPKKEKGKEADKPKEETKAVLPADVPPHERG
jgi:hypothetical protein